MLPRWKRALKFLARAESLIVIGYSLPRYDSMVRDMLLDAAKNRRIPIWVLSPRPREVAENLHDLVRSDVCALPLYWDLFSRAVLRTARHRGATSLDGLRGAGFEIAAEYQLLKDRREEEDKRRERRAMVMSPETHE